MACLDCFNNCYGNVVPDKCVRITTDFSGLDICADDSQYMWNVAMWEYASNFADGGGITLSPTSCSFLSTIHSTSDNTLPNIVQTIYTGICSLKASLDTLTIQVNTGYSYNVSCLTGITSTSSRDQILQATILKVCDNDARIEAIEDDYVKSSDLCTLVTACLTPTVPGQVEYYTRMVPYAPIPYIGSLANFDNTGKGIAGLGWDKVYLMNGLNGTQDWRGRSPIGAIQNVPGGVLDSQVDPSIPANSGTNYVLNQKVGQSKVSLLIAQIPSHSHTLTDPGHKHGITGYIGGGSSTFSAGTGNFWYHNPDTEVASTGITMGSTGGSQSHPNVQPSVACYYIIYLP